MGIVGTVREMASEQLEYRELLVQLVKRDLALRYKQTVMGFAWAVFMPLVNTAVFSVIFTRVAPVDTGVPYPLYAFCGFLFWNFFASSLRFAAVSLTSNMTLVTKVYFPREILAFSAVVVCLVDLLVGSTVLVGLMAYYRVPVTVALGLTPIILFCQLAFTAGMSLALAMMNLFYRDVKYLFEVVLTVWMFATAVMYPIDRVGGRLASVLALNPMTSIIDAYRAVLLHGQLPDPMSLGWALGVSLITLAVAWWAFHAAEFRFAESI
jgi:ABC-type polysaccharide/polyol phosphate export permease